MSNYFSQQEENFWPCVSDMFLALFIIALALFSQASESDKDADIRQEQLMADETCRLIETLSNAFPDDKDISSLKNKTESIRAQHNNGKPCERGKNCEMNKALIQLPQSASIQKLLEQQPNSTEEFDNNKFDHSDAVNYFYKYVIPKEERRGTSDDARLSQAHQEILDHIIKRDKDRFEELNKLTGADSRKLKSMLVDAQEEIKRLKLELEKIKQELNTTQVEKTKLEQSVEAKNTEIAHLEQKLGKDMRPYIMNKLQEKIDSVGCGNLVSIDHKTGVLSIPSGTLVFKNRNKTPNPYKPFADQTSEENLKKIAGALELFMEEDSREHMVDTIIIEGHADPHVRGPEFEYANDEASAWRALGTWLVLNSVCSDKFKEYKNANGGTIFGIAGYGSRNCPERETNETDTDYENRCRRIDIRFIPAPKGNL